MNRLQIRATIVAAIALCALVAAAGAAQAPKFDITGAWAFKVTTDAGAGEPTITFKQEGEKLAGHYSGTLGEAELTGTVKGADVAFSFSTEVQGFAISVAYKGTLESETAMKGTMEIVGLGSGTFTATKK